MTRLTHERVLVLRGSRSELPVIVAVHSTVLGRRSAVAVFGDMTDGRAFATYSADSNNYAPTWHAGGNLTSKNHLGVVLEGCPEDQRAWTNGIQPDIKRLGIPVELTALSCTGEFNTPGLRRRDEERDLEVADGRRRPRHVRRHL